MRGNVQNVQKVFPNIQDFIKIILVEVFEKHPYAKVNISVSIMISYVYHTCIFKFYLVNPLTEIKHSNNCCTEPGQIP